VLRALHSAVEYYTEIGRLSMAAKNLRARAPMAEATSYPLALCL